MFLSETLSINSVINVNKRQQYEKNYSDPKGGL